MNFTKEFTLLDQSCACFMYQGTAVNKEVSSHDDGTFNKEASSHNDGTRSLQSR